MSWGQHITLIPKQSAGVCMCVQEDSEHVKHGHLDSSYFLKLFHFSKAVIYGHTLSWKASALMYKLVRACNAIRVLKVWCAPIRNQPQAFWLCHSFGDLLWEWDASLLVHSALWSPLTSYIKPTSILEIGEVTNFTINFVTLVDSCKREASLVVNDSDLGVA